MSNLSSELNSAREARGMSYGQAAECIGVHRTTVMAWEARGVPRNGTARTAVLKFITETASVDPAKVPDVVPVPAPSVSQPDAERFACPDTQFPKPEKSFVRAG